MPSPTFAEVRAWAYDPELWLMDQDEDTLLHELAYVPLLLELAATPQCPKHGYIGDILTDYCRRLVLHRQEAEVRAIAFLLSGMQPDATPAVTAWLRFFQRIARYLAPPFRVNEVLAAQMGRDLLRPPRSELPVTVVKRFYIYYEVHFHLGGYDQYLYIRRDTGLFRAKLFQPINHPSELPK